MTKTEYRAYISSPHWQQTRKEFLHDEGQQCNRCAIPRWLAQIAYDQDLHVHHKSYANLGDEPWDDLEALCRRCHEVETFGRSEFTEPMSATCEGCTNKHWNPYDSFCDSCNLVFDTGANSLWQYWLINNPVYRTEQWRVSLNQIAMALTRQVGPEDAYGLILQHLLQRIEDEKAPRNADIPFDVPAEVIQ
jgi:hypothetical protein